MLTVRPRRLTGVDLNAGIRLVPTRVSISGATRRVERRLTRRVGPSKTEVQHGLGGFAQVVY